VYHDRDTTPFVADKAISVRLDAEAQSALERLTARGASQSQAIRQALIDAARTAWYQQAEEDAKRVGRDPHDRAVVAEIREFFDDLGPSW
jgi:Arc/MetJ-type ribon-helix-helix transcriptional regulator